jgi:F-type H+-transporting ATPase subunit delta
MTARGAATRYARALFDVAVAERVDLDVLQRELSGFAAMVTGHETLSRALMSPTVPAAKKRAVVDALFASGGQVSPLLGKMLALLAERDRLTLLPELAAAFERRLMDHRQVVRASLSTAVELPPERVAALRDGLAQATGREVQLETRVDPSLVGGAVARIGSTVFDGSVTTQLERLKRSLIESAQ